MKRAQWDFRELRRGRSVAFLAVASLSLILMAASAPAAVYTYTLWPSDDGYITPTGTSDTGYLLVGANGWDGAVKFSLAGVQGTVTSAELSVNPYGLPLWGNPVSVYGYGSQSGSLETSEFGAGTYLGAWTLPALGYGQDAFFDVTSLFSSVNTPYVGFNLTSGGVDVFSSRSYNYGHPSELTLTTAVPEPSSLTLLFAGSIGVMLWRSKRNSRLG